MYPLDDEFQGDLIFFATQIGNGTLSFSAPDADMFDYEEHLNQPSGLLGELFTIYFNTFYTSDLPDSIDQATTRAAQYLAFRCVPGYRMAPPLADGEVDSTSIQHPVSKAIVTFADDLGRGTLHPELLSDVAYHEYIVGTGAFLGDVFTLFTNLLRLDDEEQVINLHHARWRTAQYIRSYVDPDYQVDPPFTDEEAGWLE